MSTKERAIAVWDFIDSHTRTGWSVQSTTEQAVLVSHEFSDYGQALETARECSSIGAVVRLLGRYNDAQLAVDVDSTGSSAVLNNGDVDFQGNFAPSAVSAARAVWQGALTRVDELGAGIWTCQVDLDLVEEGQTDDVDYRLLVDIGDLEQLFTQMPYWTWKEVFGSTNRAFLVGNLAADYLATSSTLIAGIEASTRFPLGDQRVPAFRFRDPPLLEAPDPAAVFPRHWSSPGMDAMAESLWRASVALSWCAFASSIDRQDGDALRAEFFGFQRTVHVIPKGGPAVSYESARDSLELFEWAGRDSLTDHAIAVRQVASLQQSAAPWTLSADIKMAAEPVFIALRSDAVADVLKSRRELQSTVTSIAMGVAEHSASLARTAVERAVGVLLSLAAVVVSESLNVITVPLAETLRSFLAVVLFALACWTFFVEGPFVTRPIQSFRADLNVLASLLTAEDRDQISTLNTIRSAQRLAWRTRIAVAAVMLVISLVAVLI